MKVAREFNANPIRGWYHHHLSPVGPDRAVSSSSNSLFKGLPSRLRPFGLQFNIIFAILLLFIPVTCRSQFDFHLLSFSSTSFALSSSIISFVVKKDVPGCSTEKFNLEVTRFLYFFVRVQISLPYKRMERASALHTFIVENF